MNGRFDHSRPRTAAAAPERPLRDDFAIAVRPDRDLVTVEPAGDLDLATAERVAAAVSDLRAVGFEHVVIDLRKVAFMDSTGLEMLLALRECAERDGHALTLVDPPASVGRIFELTGTRELFAWRDAAGARPA
jgi:anti-anti-sigma factor